MQTALRSLLMLLLFVIQSRAEFVELTADIEITGWGPWFDPPMFEPHTSKVRCVIGTNSWLIASASDSGAKEAWHFTGSNLVTHIGAVGEFRTTAHTNDFNGDLESGPNWLSFPSEIRAAWLAFCSGPFLSRTNARLALFNPMWKETWLHSDYASEPVGFPTQITRFNDDLRLPTSVEVFSKTSQPLLQYRTLHGRGPNPASTNVMGWTFPKSFRAVQYQPVGYAKDKWEVNMTVNGTLTSIKPTSKMVVRLDSRPGL